MCGIAGWFVTEDINDEQRAAVFEIGTKLFQATQSRGTDASGFSYLHPKYNELITVKGPIAAEEMIKELKWTKLKEEKEFPMHNIMHCRQMTKGDPIKNENNHPLVVNKEIAVVHNGCIRNDDSLRAEYSLKGKGEVDSEVIPMLIKMRIEELLAESQGDKKVDPIKVCKAINMASQELEGGFACAMVNKHTPKALYLFNHANPIVMAYSEELKTIFFASTALILREAFKATVNETVTEISTFHKWFKKVKTNAKYNIVDNSVDGDTITLIRKKEDGEIEINFYEMKTKPFSAVSTTSKDLTLTRSLKTKNGFNTSASYAGEEDEDWMSASAGRGGSCNIGPHNSHLV